MKSLKSNNDRGRKIRGVLLGFILAGFMLFAGASGGAAPVALGADAPVSETGQTPPRLSFTDGQVSFWRPGAEDWATAQVNTPLAPGDQLYTGSPGTMELQIGARAFVRGWANTQIGLENRDPDFLQFKVTTGTAAFDLRSLESGRTVEVDTPNAAFTIERSGYYRVDVRDDHTSFVSRRAGQATVIPASGEALTIAPSEEVVIEGTSSPRVASYVAPRLDDWDRWNYARTDAVLDAVSARYVAPGTYGLSDLDRYGSWRVVPTYGSVWVPAGLSAGWTPYSTGTWMMDPLYGWTWVDVEPWGWAPFHYGRWVMVDGFWAWAPGPLVLSPVYAPALVAFFDGPFIGWVSLGWGEPCIPWWGRPGFVHRPWWGGWGGPRIVNNVVINRTTVVKAQNITVYRNAGIANAVVAVDRGRFGRGPITEARVTHVDMKSFQPSRGAPRIAASAASFVPTAGRGIRPPEDALRRSVVATRPPHSRVVGTYGKERPATTTAVPAPAPRLVPQPQRGARAPVLGRPPFGRSTVELPQAEHAAPPLPQRSEGRRPGQAVPGGTAAPSGARPALPERAGSVPNAAPALPQAQPGQARVPQSPRRTPQAANLPPAAAPAQPGRAEQPALPRQIPRPSQSPGLPGAPPSAQPGRAVPPPLSPRSLPGEPANRLAPERMEGRSLPRESREASPRSRGSAVPENERQERRGR